MLTIHDLEKSVEYCSKKLGFKLLSKHSGWAFIGRASFVIMLGECSNAISPKALGDHSYFAYIDVENAEALYEEFSVNKVVIHKALKSEPWGMKEFTIETIDGHRIMFGEAV